MPPIFQCLKTIALYNLSSFVVVFGGKTRVVSLLWAEAEVILK